MKIYIAFTLAMLVMTMPALANDTTIDLNIWTDGNVNFNSNINTNGSVDITIDGTNFVQELNHLDGIKVEWSDLTYIFQYMNRYFHGLTEIYDSRVIDMFNSLNQIFVNRRDEAIINAKLNDLNVRVKALEKTMEDIASESYCQGKIDAMKELGYASVGCTVGNQTTIWYNNMPGNQVIGITSIE